MRVTQDPPYHETWFAERTLEINPTNDKPSSLKRDFFSLNGFKGIEQTFAAPRGFFSADVLS